MDRMGETLQADPLAASRGHKAPETPPAPPTPPVAPQTPEKRPDAPTGTETAKETPPVKPEVKAEPKVGASELLKQLASGEKKEPALAEKPPTQEQKKEYSMKELRLQAEKSQTLEKELADARKELETARANHAPPEEIKTLTEERDAIRAERDDYKKRVAAVDITQSDPYIENVTKPMEALWKDLNKAAEDFKFDMRGLAVAIQIPDHRQRLAAISKVLDSAEGDLDPMNRNDLVNTANEFLRREFYGRQLLEDGVKTQEALKADKARKDSEEKETRTKSANEQADHIFRQMFSEASLADMPFLAPKDADGKPTPNKELLAQIRKSATTEKEPWRNALDSYSTELLPVVMDYAKGQDAKIAELEERVAKLSGAGPKPGGPIVHEEGGEPKASMVDEITKLQRGQGLPVG